MTRYHLRAPFYASLLILLLWAPVTFATDDTPPPKEVEEVDPDGLEGVETRPGLNEKIEIGYSTTPTVTQSPFFKTYATLRMLWAIRLMSLGY